MQLKVKVKAYKRYTRLQYDDTIKGYKELIQWLVDAQINKQVKHQIAVESGVRCITLLSDKMTHSWTNGDLSWSCKD